MSNKENNELNNNEVNSNRVTNFNDLKWSETFKSGYRGEQPEDINIICHKLCKEYLSGVWSKISVDKINIRRITGGLSNQLYYCGNPDIKPIGDEPTEVAIRIYGKKHLSLVEEGENERLTDTVIGVLLSENNLSPKIYGFFGNGEILKYYKNHQFQLEQQKDPKLVKELAQKLAKFHSLKVPIKRNNNLIFDMIYDSHAKAYKMYPISQLMDECKCETLKKVNLLEETDWIKTIVNATNSPIVFTHFDFRGSNILVIDEDVNDYNPESRIVFCDYEYADYYPRGMDFSSIFLEWGRSLDEWLNLKDFPEPSIMTPFLNAYVEESAKIYGSDYLLDKNNSVEHIVYEINVFILVRSLMGAIIGLAMNVDNDQHSIFSTKENHMSFSEMSIKNYMQLKNKFVIENFY